MLFVNENHIKVFTMTKNLSIREIQNIVSDVT